MPSHCVFKAVLILWQKPTSQRKDRRKIFPKIILVATKNIELIEVIYDEAGNNSLQELCGAALNRNRPVIAEESSVT